MARSAGARCASISRRRRWKSRRSIRSLRPRPKPPFSTGRRWSGTLRVEGWVVCLVQIESVEVFVDGERIGEAEFGRVRDDVETVRANYPNTRFSGFMLISDIGRLGAGPKTVTVRALARTGIMREVAAGVEIPKLSRARSAEPGDTFHHHCDEIALTTAGGVVLKGWAVCASPTAAVKVLLDGDEIGDAELGMERPD